MTIPEWHNLKSDIIPKSGFVHHFTDTDTETVDTCDNFSIMKAEKSNDAISTCPMAAFNSVISAMLGVKWSLATN